MNKVLKHILIILSAAYFLVAGTGYNVVKYCCKSCESSGILKVQVNSCNMNTQAKTEKSCCDEVNNQQSDNVLTNFTKGNPMGCFFYRVALDVPVFESTKNFEIPFSKKIHTHFTTQIIFSTYKLLISEEIFPPPKYKIPLTGREILMLKNVLII